MAALSDVLVDFGARPFAAPRPAASPPSAPAGGAPSAPLQPPLDIEALLAAERAAAEAALAERLSREHEEALAAEREHHAGEMEALAARLGTEAADMIARRFGEAEARLTELATSAIARILAGLVSDEVRRLSIERLGAAIREALEDGEAVRVRVFGPQSLFSALAERLGDTARQLHHVEAPGLDVVVDIDGELFETRLSDWSSMLAEALS